MNFMNVLGESTTRVFQQQTCHFQRQIRIHRSEQVAITQLKSIMKEGIFPLGLKLFVIIKTCCLGRFFSVYKTSQP